MPATNRPRRINLGLYEFTHKGRVFQIEDIKRASDGDCLAGWIAYEVKGDRREYLNDYRTKGWAYTRTIEAVDEGY